MMTCQLVGEKLLAYLNADISIKQLVNWAETTMVYSELELYVVLLSEVIGRIRVADVESFKLSWEDIAPMMERFGYRTEVELKAA